MIRWAVGLVLFGLAAAGLFLFATGQIDIGGREKAEASIETGRADAALASGGDAANTVDAAGDRESAIDDITQENADAIHAAEGADAPVNPHANTAGLRALCRRAAYRNLPRCLQLADP